jgi:hypothetical protein
MNPMRKKLTLVLILAITLSTISATQYVRADVGFSYEIVHPSDADIRYIGSDNAADGLRVLRADSSNSSVSLEFGKWSGNQTKTYTAAFGIVNEELFAVTITDLEVVMDGLDPDYMQVWLHSNEDILAEYETAGNAVFMWNQGVNPNDLSWTLGPGNQNSADASFGSTPWDEFSQVRFGANTSQAGIQNSSDFVWVQISLVVASGVSQSITGSIVFDIQSETSSSSVFTDPVSLWRFDEGSGDIAYDSSGSNHGVLGPSYPGNAPLWVQAYKNYGLSFDGNDRVVVNDETSLDISEEGSLLAWFKLDIYRDYGGIIHKGDRNDFSDESYFLQLGGPYPGLGNNKRLIGGGHDGNDNVFLLSSFELSLDVWYHAVYTWDAYGQKLYINGVLDNSTTDVLMTRITDGTLQIGSQLPNNYFFDGIIDEVAIYDVALSAQEIQLLYTS